MVPDNDVCVQSFCHRYFVFGIWCSDEVELSLGRFEICLVVTKCQKTHKVQPRPRAECIPPVFNFFINTSLQGKKHEDENEVKQGLVAE